MSGALMTRGEREDLQRLIRQREKVQKSAAKQRSTELLADFENQMASEYAFDDEEVWQEASRLAEQEVAKANQRIAERCKSLGIPKQFAPGLSLGWNHRGYGNSVAKRRSELRTVALTRIAALEQAADVQIELDSVNAQTEIAASGLTSEAARTFLAKLTPVEELMPKLSFEEIAGPANPPVAEQLVSPSALRMRRHRERKAALCDVTQASRDAESDADLNVSDEDVSPRQDGQP